MIVADSDVLIDTLRGRDPSRARVRKEIETGGLATTAVNAFEILSGVRTASDRDRVQKLLAALTIYPLDEAAGNEAAAIRRHLEERGQGLETADYLIAGVCLARGATLLTRNRAHFERVPGLALGTLP